VAIDDDGDGKSGEDPALADTIANGSNCFGIHDNDGDGLLDEDPGFGAELGIDNDGDGLIDEDPIDGIDNDLDGLIDEDDPDDDGDGLIDEDGPDDDRDGLIDEDDNCADIVEFMFQATFDVSGLDIDAGLGVGGGGDGIVPSDDDLRIDLLVTFVGGGKRGGTCKLDVDCDGVLEDGKGGTNDEGEGHVRTIQQRLQFDPPVCPWECETVTLEDLGAAALDDCVLVTSTALDETIWATEVDGTQSTFQVTGTVSCASCLPVEVPGDLEAALDLYNDGGSVPGGTANINVAYPGGDSYFNSTVSNAGDFDGTYDGWCIDVNTTISPGTTYCTELISSYDSFADNLVDVPYLGGGERTLDLVNWIINQDFTTQAATCVARNYTYGDIQRAIWDLVNPTSTSGLGTWTQCAADEIRSAALSAGVGFVPDCGEQVAVIFNPCGNTGPSPSGGYQITIFQITLGSLALPCETVTICDECHTQVTNTATLTCADGSDNIEGSPASASFDVWCMGMDPNPPGIGVGDFCSQTQGGWGTDNCNGNNTACLLAMYFDAITPVGGLIVGDPDGPDADGSWSILLTDSAAVAAYLPAGGAPAALTADLTDPAVTASGVFGGQLVAATLNVLMDDNGFGKCSLTMACTFPNPPGTLRTLIYGDCVVAGLQGLSVDQVLALANTAISGGGTPAGVSISDLGDALAVLNEEFVDCDTVATGCLQLP
jgi:hypothetical protein